MNAGGLVERRCLYCRQWLPVGGLGDNPESDERAMEVRYGPEIAMAGGCGHPEPVRVGATSKAACHLWELRLS